MPPCVMTSMTPDGIAALLTEDALWEITALGQFEGREAIRSASSFNGITRKW
jgi:hypothetical protein